MKFDDWVKLVLETCKRRDEQEEKRFLELLDIDDDYPPKEKAYILFRTFSNDPDYGTQERVISTILSLGEEIYIETLLQELPRLKRDASDWVEALLGPEIIHRPTILKRVLSSMSDEVKDEFLEVISRPEFSEFIPESKDFL